MEFKINNTHDFSRRKTKISDKEEKQNNLFSIFKRALDNQIFFNSRYKALEFIENQGKVTTAMLTTNIVKVKGILGANYEIKFSLLYSKSNGQILQAKNFYRVEIPGKEGMIPIYILNALEEDDSLDIMFDIDDLSALYSERDVKIDEESTFDEIIELCEKENVAAIKLIDRVFYTRILCYNSAKENIGVIHVGALHRLPKDLAKKLYPGGQAEFSI